MRKYKTIDWGGSDKKATTVPARIEHTVALDYRLFVKKSGEKVLQGAFEWECGEMHGFEWRDVPEVKEE